MFLVDDKFDKGMVYFVRRVTKNFMELNADKTINSIPIQKVPVLDQFDSDDPYHFFIDNILMKMGEDVASSILPIVPITLRMNIHIVDVNKQSEFNLIESMAVLDDICLQSDND